mmetsp:Transcript_67240/g.216967  ORF Transcript_67240/g.216967 Transcript_67240/m.216967 type:complete len:281 (-) Transcript_67240:2182-3024(-)
MERGGQAYRLLHRRQGRVVRGHARAWQPLFRGAALSRRGHPCPNPPGCSGRRRSPDLRPGPNRPACMHQPQERAVEAFQAWRARGTCSLLGGPRADCCGPLLRRIWWASGIGLWGPYSEGLGLRRVLLHTQLPRPRGIGEHCEVPSREVAASHRRPRGGAPVGLDDVDMPGGHEGPPGLSLLRVLCQRWCGRAAGHRRQGPGRERLAARGGLCAPAHCPGFRERGGRGNGANTGVAAGELSGWRLQQGPARTVAAEEPEASSLPVPHGRRQEPSPGVEPK